MAARNMREKAVSASYFFDVRARIPIDWLPPPKTGALGRIRLKRRRFATGLQRKVWIIFKILYTGQEIKPLKFVVILRIAGSQKTMLRLPILSEDNGMISITRLFWATQALKQEYFLGKIDRDRDSILSRQGYEQLLFRNVFLCLSNFTHCAGKSFGFSPETSACTREYDASGNERTAYRRG